MSATTPALLRERLGRVYTAEGDLPFVSDGEQALIGENVDKVKRRSGSDDGRIYARKSVTIDEEQKELVEDAKRKLLREARTLSYARHSHVVEIVDAYFFEGEVESLFSVVMERADTNLTVYLKRKVNPNRISRLAGWFGCLISAVASIHALGIRHRDIKPSNILVKGQRVLLADFGISKMGLGKTMPTTVPALARPRAADYCAPEVEEGSTRGRSADIFSLGAVFLEMLITHSYFRERRSLDDKLTSFGRRSYAKSVAQVHDFIDRIERESRPEEWALEVISWCRKMLHVDRYQRPLADDLQSAWGALQPKHLPLVRCTCSEVGISDERRFVQLCTTGTAEDVDIYLSSGRDLTIPGAIHQASAHGRKSIVEKFLASGVDSNLRDCGGQTALHCAAGYGHKAVVDMLLENGANPQIKDDEGQTALQCAAGQGHLCVVERLLSNGADIQAVDVEGRTALQFAATRGHDNVVRELLDRGADAVHADAKERTALHFAAGCGFVKVVEMLSSVMSGSAVGSRDVNGQTALDFAAGKARAAEANYLLIQKLLQEKTLVSAS